jgi:hypothetical protein
MSDNRYRSMSEADLIREKLAAHDAGTGHDQRMNSALAEAELIRRERDHQKELAEQQRQIADAQAEAAQSAARAAKQAALATWGLVLLGIATLIWQVFSALHRTQ